MVSVSTAGKMKSTIATVLLLVVACVASVSLAVSVGDEVCVEGFVMDIFCIKRGVLFDNPNVITLLGPQEHSYHCLLDVNECITGNYTILKEPETGSTMYSIAYMVDEAGKQRLLNLGRSTGKNGMCGSCTAASGPTKGFRAEVRGVVTRVGDGTQNNPSEMRVTAAEATLSGVNLCGFTPVPRSPTAPSPISSPVTSSPVTKPTSSPVNNPLVLPGCFSGMNTIEVQGKGTVLMETLQIGDYVKSGEGTFSRVYSFAHLDVDIDATYLQIETDDSSNSAVLEITTNHILFSKGQAVAASSVQVGDSLSSGKVVDIKVVKRRGVYAPLTESGKIVVSGILSSSHTVLLEVPVFLQHYMAQTVLVPHRLMCAVMFGLCEKETYTRGFSTYIIGIGNIVWKVAALPAWLQLLCTLLALPVFIALFLVETAFQAQPSVTVLLVTYLFVKQHIAKRKVA